MEDSMLLMTSAQLDLETYLEKKHHKKKHGGKTKKDGPMIQESKGTRSEEPTDFKTMTHDIFKDTALVKSSKKKHQHKKHNKHVEEDTDNDGDVKDSEEQQP